LDKNEMIEQFLYYLVLHEMGHTMGLMHNMKSSQLHSIENIHNKELTMEVGLIASVMDYPAVNFNLDRENQGQYWTMKPGPYDIWAIEFAYGTGRTEEETQALLARSTDSTLIFGNDADDMRSPGKAIDPRVNVGDLTSDAIEYAVDRIKLSREISTEILDRSEKLDSGYSHQNISNAYSILINSQYSSSQTISRYIGGVYVDRAFIGQEGATKPFTPVDLETQKEAMKALKDYVFAPDAFTVSNDIYNYIQKQRRGFGFFSQSEDPKIHNMVSRIQIITLSHVLHPNTLQRIVDSELYGNEYTLSTMMADLNSAIFDEDIQGNVNSFRQNLQINYTKMLINMVSGKQSGRYLPTAKSMAIYNLNLIKKMATSSTGDVATKAHKQHLLTLITNALQEVK
jgi:hypothetical protein